MSPDFYNLAPEDRVIVLVEIADVKEAESLVLCCEHCGPDVANLPFDIIVDILSESDPATTDYVLERPATCPRCGHEILEKTLVAI
jgi:hypothetical protein